VKGKMKNLTIALAGNPNSGKSSIFNNLTGARQHVGNYPGVTVEKKEGFTVYKNYKITIVDLPGTYSLSAYSDDEIIARKFIIENQPDVVVDVIDTCNLERNLYLATQLLELNKPLVLAFNMSDISGKKGILIDREKLTTLISAPVVLTVGSTGSGMKELLDKTIELFEHKSEFKAPFINYGSEVNSQLNKLVEIIKKEPALPIKFPTRWFATKLLENDDEIIAIAEKTEHRKELLEQKENSSKIINNIYNDTPEAIIAEHRYGFISGACSEAVKYNYEIRHSISDKIDTVLINRVLGLPIFLLFIWFLFNFTFKLSSPLMSWIEIAQNFLSGWFGTILPQNSMLYSLVVDAVIGGVGSVLIFLPIIFLLFLAISFLEDTGYMARGAFIMDHFMHKIGLHGSSFIPMVLGFGCNLPAIMATRSIKDRKDRLVTILVNPFMSCSARLPVYSLLIAAFFSKEIAGNVLFSIYLLGIVVAVIMAKIFRKFLFKGSDTPFVMELPPYRMPTVKGLLLHMWERGKVYLKKAGTIIFAGCTIMWFLSNFPWNPDYSKNYDQLIQNAGNNQELAQQLNNEKSLEKMEKSYAGIIGKNIAPVFKPLGFGDWRISVGLIGGFVAKEIVVGTLGTLYSAGDAGSESKTLREALRNDTNKDGSKKYNPLTAYSLMVFVLLYIPCIAVIGVIKRETNSWFWPAFTAVYTTAVAWIVSFFVYQGGLLLGLGA
jgi:ferrous iron transport protein B